MVMDVGVYSRNELRRLGVDEPHLRRCVRDGSLTRLRSGWYATATPDPDVAEAVRRGGVLGCVSALRKHGLWVPPGYERLHVRASKHGKQLRAGSCQGPGRPRPADAALDSVPVALGCASRCMSAEDWVAVCDSVLNTLGLTVSKLQLEMGTISGRIGNLMDKCDPRSQSGTESLARLRLRAAGFTVHVQPSIPEVGWVDLRVGRLLIECDSKEHHTGFDNYQNDRRRDRNALVGKWLTMRITYDDVLYGWNEVMADVRAITQTDRHRMRQRNSARSAPAEGNVPSAPPEGDKIA
nr:hypothetical protein [Williamsia sp. 1138]